ncbi:MAG: TaqI-like C-terminal specificity domain-containing protein [Acidobacteriota bacterium]
MALEIDLLQPSVSGTQIKRYRDWVSDQLIIYTARETPIKNFPNVATYLEQFRGLNSCREVKEGRHPWWALHRPRDQSIFESPKIIGLTTTKSIELIFDPNSSVYVTDAMYVFRAPKGWDPWHLIAIMQSKLFLFLYRTANQGESRVIPQIKASKLETLPVPGYEPASPKWNQLSVLISHMRNATEQRGAAQTERDKTFYENKCASLDRQIDNLVYELYDLTPEEIAIIEGQSK